MFKQFLNQPVSEGGASKVGVEEDDITNDINSLVKKVFSDTAKTSVRLKKLLEALEQATKNKVTEETKADVDKAVPVGNPETTVMESETEAENTPVEDTPGVETTGTEAENTPVVEADGVTETVADGVTEAATTEAPATTEDNDGVETETVGTEDGVDPAVKQGGRKPRKTKRKRNRNRNRSSKKSKNKTLKKNKSKKKKN